MLWKLCVLVVMAIGVGGELQVNQAQVNTLIGAVRSACEQRGVPEQPQKAMQELMRCFSTIINVENIKQEIEAAKPNGALDEVFKKYCAKSPEMKACVSEFARGVAPCAERAAADNVQLANNITAQLMDFACYNDGDRIALFVADGGPQCFQDKAGEIRQCITTLKDSLQTIDDFKKLTLNEGCSRFDGLGACSARALEACATPTPANMVEALFRFVRKGSPCKSIIKT